MFLGRPNTATAHDAHGTIPLCILHTRTNLPFPSLQPVHTPATSVVHRSCLLCLVVNSSSSTIILFPFLSYSFLSLLETLPMYRIELREIHISPNERREFSKENSRIFPSSSHPCLIISWNLKRERERKKKSTVAAVIEIHTVPSKMSYLFVLFFRPVYDKWSRKKERRIRIRKKFITRRNLVRANLLFFFLLVSFTGGVMPGYFIIFCKMNSSFFTRHWLWFIG